jgi:cation/acetate symporter
MGIFSLRMNKEGAIAGMLAGLTFTFVYIAYFKFLAPEANSAAHWWLGISPEGIGALGALLNFTTAFVVSRFGRPVPAYVQELVHRIRIPRGAGAPGNH